MTFGETVRTIRQTLQLKQEGFARELGLSQGKVSKYERSDRPIRMSRNVEIQMRRLAFTADRMTANKALDKQP